MVLEILRQHPFRTKILRNAPRFILCSSEVIENKRLSLAFISRLSNLRDNSFLFGLYSVTRLAFQHHHVQSIFLCCIWHDYVHWQKPGERKCQSRLYTYVLQWWWELCLSQTLLDNSPVQNTAHQLEKKQVRQELFQVVLFFFFPLFHRKVARISNDMAFSSAFKRKQKVNKQTSKLNKYITHFAP